MLKAVRASLTAGILSWVMSRPKVVPPSSQSPLQGFLLTETGDFLVQEDGSYLVLY